LNFIQPEGKRPLGRPRSRWEDNIFRKWVAGGALIGLIWLRVGTGGGHLVMNLWVLCSAGNFLNS